MPKLRAKPKIDSRDTLAARLAWAAQARRRLARSAVAALALSACSGRSGGGPPPRYPPLPPGPSASSEAPAFEPAPALSAVTFACRASEPALANALDDDCDGRIDGAEAELLLAFAYPPASMELELRAETSAASKVEAQTSCESAGFCTLRFRPHKLAHGRYTLALRNIGEGTAPAAALVSVQTRGEVRTYLLKLDAEQRDYALGRLALP